MYLLAVFYTFRKRKKTEGRSGIPSPDQQRLEAVAAAADFSAQCRQTAAAPLWAICKQQSNMVNRRRNRHFSAY